MIKLKLLLIFFLTPISSILAQEFEYSKEVASDYAKARIKEFSYNQSQSTQPDEFDYTKVNYHSDVSSDCDNIKFRYVLVAFEGLDGGNAVVILRYSKDDIFSEFISVFFTSQTFKEIIEEIENTEPFDYWNCGI